jgi:hypothetical protein
MLRVKMRSRQVLPRVVPVGAIAVECVLHEIDVYVLRYVDTEVAA